MPTRCSDAARQRRGEQAAERLGAGDRYRVQIASGRCASDAEWHGSLGWVLFGVEGDGGGLCWLLFTIWRGSDLLRVWLVGGVLVRSWIQKNVREGDKI